MHVSRELDYAMRAVLVLSAHEGEIVSKRRIASEMEIPINFLAVILPKLVHDNIVESLPGPKGGYRLFRPAGKISMLDVIRSIESSFAFNRCLNESKGCMLQVSCPIKLHWRKVQTDVESYLGGVLFDDLAKNFNVR